MFVQWFFEIFLSKTLITWMNMHFQMENQSLYQFWNLFAQLVRKFIFVHGKILPWTIIHIGFAGDVSLNSVCLSVCLLLFQIVFSQPNQIWLGWFLHKLLFWQNLTKLAQWFRCTVDQNLIGILLNNWIFISHSFSEKNLKKSRDISPVPIFIHGEILPWTII